MSYLKVCYSLIVKNLALFIQTTCVVLFFSCPLLAQNTQEFEKKYITIDNAKTSYPLTKYLRYYDDKNGNLSIDEISKMTDQFSDVLQITENTKYVWAYFDVKNKTDEEWLIDTKTENSVLYVKRNNEWKIYTPSNYLYSREYILLPISKFGTSERIYVKIIPYPKMGKTKSHVYMRQRLSYEQRFLNDTIFYMLVVGVIFGLFFYNLFLAISTKSYSYYFYSFSILIGGLLFLFYSMLFREFLMEKRYVSLISNILTPLSIISFVLFSLAYFKESLKSKWTKVIIFLILFNVVASTIYTYNTFYYSDSSYAPLGNISIISIYTSLLVFSIYKTKKGALGGRWFLLANSLLIITILIAIIVSQFLTAINIGYAIGVGVVIQLLLFSFALGSRFNSIKKQIAQKEMEQKELEKNQLLELQKLTEQKNIELEEKVENRTSKLREANQEMESLIEELDTTNSSLKSTYAQLQVQHKKITDSIYYANNIQKAVLPAISNMKADFPDLFVFFRPRNVVSGDFYWYKKLEDDKYLLGAFDCTGHGVPGAFMSMISSQILNEIVSVHKKIMPNEILDELRKTIYFSLKQNENANKDGLDACLVLIDRKDETLYFSGAQNPLYYIQKDTLETIKGDNIYIGGRYNHSDKFTLHSISFAKQKTLFYLASDGIQDQFGGKENRKLMRKAFKKHLERNQNLSSKEQNMFWKSFVTEWQGKNQQTDDMLLIGFRP
ncbi:7TM diverse intracellular signaling domain-containing protein [Bernardetia sp.]|uniref:7TM diverse intracellular signaling domain-containing protein n=1 Tax=Bernardetia sp. TaxID=1937974 RepID=UPI0025C17021|nr:7TM diverse intracellular signaling domain-containing protein [Bernardetia sp.]